MLEYFKNAWPEGCHSALIKKEENMAERNKSSHVGESEVFDLNATYPVVRAPLSSDCKFDVGDVLSGELAPVPPSMFTNDGMQLCKIPNLPLSDCPRLKFPEEMLALLTYMSSTSQLFCSKDNLSAHWWHSWRFCEGLKEAYRFVLTDNDVYLIFDMCYGYSIKSVTGMLRRRCK